MMRTLRMILGILLAVIGVNAFGGGYYGMCGASDIPIEWLQGSPFSSYFIPALFLFAVVGGSCSVGAIMAFKNSRYARSAAFVCSVILLCWIFIQVRIIGYVSWMQPAIFVSGLIIFCLGYFLPGVQSRSKQR